MTDINKQIEDEAREYAKSICYPLVLVDHEHRLQSVYRLVEKVYERGYNSALHSSRWRRVSEGLPEVKDENFFINIKRYDNEFRIDTICVFAEMEDVKGYLEFNNVDSWKPID